MHWLQPPYPWNSQYCPVKISLKTIFFLFSVSVCIIPYEIFLRILTKGISIPSLSFFGFRMKKLIYLFIGVLVFATSCFAGVDFDGSNDKIIISDNDAFTPAGGLTI